jgi:hypothetical protein
MRVKALNRKPALDSVDRRAKNRLDHHFRWFWRGEPS